MVTGLAYRISGEAGVGWVVPVLSAAITTSLFVTLGSLIPPAFAASAVWVPIVLVPKFTYRLFYFRPHLLAILVFTWIFYACLRKNRWLLLSPWPSSR